ncbi:MAG: type II methionyl aminopeptidase [Candidatus Aenigmatarchaeota archaeon]|nr:MAG: type II methionyl aminopeptidase [Candidatus Aenigmarchaeota archaeon]
MQSEEIEYYKKAGEVAARIKKEVLGIIKPGLPLLKLAEFIEQKIREYGCEPAFPPNISIDDIAAHDTPRYADERVIPEGSLVKIDLGVHFNGYIGDLAFTWCSEPREIIKANEAVLEKAIQAIRPGVDIAEISALIQDTAREQGFGVIANLTGHGLERYQFHAPPSIPNVRTEASFRLEKGQVIALEPFLTEGGGWVKESGNCEIFRFQQEKPVRLQESRQILKLAKEEWHGLPFAKRWLYSKISPVKLSLALKELEAVEALESFPVLKETSHKPVSQAEHTVIVLEKPLITTWMKIS